jgi:hypothetical protein
MHDWRVELERLVLACDHTGTNRLLINLAVAGLADEAGPAMAGILDHASHEVQQWWLGECNCDGHLN